MDPAARRPRVIALVGATATGKTDLGEGLARALGAEVICADSRQVFRELEIGTGKPTAAQRAAWPHHLFDALALGERASAGWYARACAEARSAVRVRGRVPLLVGGSGLYLRAAERGLAPEPPHDSTLRSRLREELEERGPEALHHRLASLDPETASRLAPRDRQRIVRALEVVEAGGRPLSWWRERQARTDTSERWITIQLVLDPAAARERIARRTRWMFDHGLAEETRELLVQGRRPALAALRAVGYDEAIAWIDGRVDRATAEAEVNRRTAQLAKRQRTWFRHQTRAHRLDAGRWGARALLARALPLAARALR